jgi:hypothetical protein|tara:strand:- start:50 stop:1066 length:1017 start_codon:yes stop_codon:yes gene_type:complete
MPFKSDKQRRWMHLHHPEIAKDWEKKYKDGGFVEEAKEASVQGDVVDAKLTPKETILNWEHMQALQEYVGEPIEKVFQKIGLPGFETGEFQAKGGGVASKKDYLMKYKDSGVEYGTPLYKAPKYKGAPLPPEIKRQKTSQERGLDRYQGMLDQPGGIKGALERAFKTMKEEPIKDWYKGGGTAKKKQLMNYYENGGVGERDDYFIKTPSGTKFAYKNLLRDIKEEGAGAVKKTGENISDLFDPWERFKKTDQATMTANTMYGGGWNREGLSREDYLKKAYSTNTQFGNMAEEDLFWDYNPETKEYTRRPGKEHFFKSKRNKARGGVAKKKRKKQKRGY